MTTDVCNRVNENNYKIIKLEKNISLTEAKNKNVNKSHISIEPKSTNQYKIKGEFNRSKSFHNYNLSSNRMSDTNISKKSSKYNQYESLSHLRPSEGLFVRCLLPNCKRLAPLWFKGVSSMREKNREEHRRISAAAACQNQNDWERISNVIKDMSPSSETDTVVNLLKKLYKELPADSVLWFIKCWLNFTEAQSLPEKCAVSRGDVRGRMRRIDGGKGSDKVWRLDTIVGMMYHGMPMSSTDTNIMVHTCDEELCIRPQHLRFKASSVALVVVLKALQQTGYSIIPPQNDTVSRNSNDEFVDVSGPFSIEELQEYRLEQLRPCEKSMGKLNSSSTDLTLLESYPMLKDFYPTYSDNLKFNISHTGTTLPTHNRLLHHSPINSCIIKRPPQTTSNSTCSPPNLDPSSININNNNTHSNNTSSGSSLLLQCNSPPMLGARPQKCEIVPTPRKPQQMLCHGNLVGRKRRYNDNTLDTDEEEDDQEQDHGNKRRNHQVCNDEDDVIEDDDDDEEDEMTSEANNNSTEESHRHQDLLMGYIKVSPQIPPTLHMAEDCLQQHRHRDHNISGCTEDGNFVGRPWSQISGGGDDSPLSLSATTVGLSGGLNGNSSQSGKTTPRQPAKKRLEARTPTIFVPINAEPCQLLMTTSATATTVSSVATVTSEALLAVPNSSSNNSPGSITDYVGSAFKKVYSGHSNFNSIIPISSNHKSISTIDSNTAESDAEVDEIFDSNDTKSTSAGGKQQHQQMTNTTSTTYTETSSSSTSALLSIASPMTTSIAISGNRHSNLETPQLKFKEDQYMMSLHRGSTHYREALQVNAGSNRHGADTINTLSGGSCNRSAAHNLTTPSPIDMLIMAMTQEMDDTSPQPTPHSSISTTVAASSSSSTAALEPIKQSSLDCYGNSSVYTRNDNSNNGTTTVVNSANMSLDITRNSQQQHSKSNHSNNQFNNSNTNNSNSSSHRNTFAKYRFTPEQASVLLNAMRTSPLGNNNPEIIDILYNMTLQYGFNPPVSCSDNSNPSRTDSVALRKQIYQQLTKTPPVHESRYTPLLNLDDNQ